MNIPLNNLSIATVYLNVYPQDNNITINEKQTINDNVVIEF